LGSASSAQEVSGTSIRKRVKGAEAVDYVRSIAGVVAVIAADVFVAAIAGVFLLVANGDQQLDVSIATAAFTAISSVTAAYFGIRAATQTAQHAMNTATQTAAAQAQTAAPQPQPGPASAQTTGVSAQAGTP
jgi:hypothetical protein